MGPSWFLSTTSTHKLPDIYFQLYKWDDHHIFLITSFIITRLLSDCIGTRTHNHLVCKQTRSLSQTKSSLIFRQLQSVDSTIECGVPWHSGNYRVWIHSETHTWHDKNIQPDCYLMRFTSLENYHLIGWW